MATAFGSVTETPKNRGIIAFFAQRGSAVGGTDYYVGLAGASAGAGALNTTQANAQLTISGYSMVIREIHAIDTVGITQVVLQDDGADTSAATGAGAANTEASATGLSVTVAAGSKVNLRFRPSANGAGTLTGFMVVEVTS